MAGYIGSRASVVSSGAERKKVFAITTTTTSLTGLVYTPNLVHVFHNGIRLVDGTDYTATNGTTITLTNAAQNGDEVVVVSYATFQTSDTVSASAGGTFSNPITIDGDGATVLTVDRATSDGTIVDFQKNGTSVGSIGTGLSSLAIGTGNTQLMFWNAQSGIFPSNGTTVTDNSIDFGNPNYRFKDLYLSGGVYLGGTGSANLLDDYEEGTWTPTLLGSSSNPTVSYDTTHTRGVYVKVGKIVYYSYEVRTNSISGGGGSVLIGGFPFYRANVYPDGDRATVDLYNISFPSGVNYVVNSIGKNTNYSGLLAIRPGLSHTDILISNWPTSSLGISRATGWYSTDT